MMSITVRLDTAMEGLVNRLAKQRGITKSELIREALRRIADENQEKKPRRPYDAISHLIGCAHGGPPTLSEQTGQKFHKLLRHKLDLA
jgi:metal-responsive CopG/Arc/MetJ family transcriptional regulator